MVLERLTLFLSLSPCTKTVVAGTAATRLIVCKTARISLLTATRWLLLPPDNGHASSHALRMVDFDGLP